MPSCLALLHLLSHSPLPSDVSCFPCKVTRITSVAQNIFAFRLWPGKKPRRNHGQNVQYMQYLMHDEKMTDSIARDGLRRNNPVLHPKSFKYTWPLYTVLRFAGCLPISFRSHRVCPKTRTPRSIRLGHWIRNMSLFIMYNHDPSQNSSAKILES